MSSPVAMLREASSRLDPAIAEMRRLSEFSQRPIRPPVLEAAPVDPLRPATIVVIGDSHTDPDHGNDRFTWLGRYLADARPPVVVDIGDQASLSSLSSYDEGTVRGFGQRYREEIVHAWDAQERIQVEIDRYNRTRAGKAAPYAPLKVRTLGNHEDRITRLLQREPRWQGLIGLDDLGGREYGWQVVPFLQPVEVQGIHFAHYVTSGAMGKPIGGEYPAANILRKHFMPTVVGHGHYFDVVYRTRRDGRKMIAATAGCFFQHDEPWSVDNHRWDRGLMVLHNAIDGMADVEWLGMERLKARYA